MFFFVQVMPIYLQDSEVVARLNHFVKLFAGSTATVCDAVADRLISLPPRILRFCHYAMFHRRRYLIHRIHTPLWPPKL